MNTRTVDLVYRLRDSIYGDPWYGDSIIKKLITIDSKTASSSPLPDIHSIAEIVQHLINWHGFTVRKINGDKQFVIEQNDANDWTSAVINSESDWTDLVHDFKTSVEELIEALKNKEDTFLGEDIPGKPYTFGYLLEGIVQHNIYHLGQIALVKKWINLKNNSAN